MQAQKSTLTERLGQIEPVEVDGEVLWEAEKVYRAFHIDPRTASKCIRREHKRRVLVFRQGYRSRHKYYLDRGGVETLAILYGQQRARRSWPPCAGPDEAVAR